MVAAAATGGLAAAVPAAAARRVETLLTRLTLDEKITFLHGATDPALGEAGCIPGVPRLGIPPLRLSDGPAGVRVTAHATALVSGDPHRYPGVDGEECYSEGIHVGYRWYDAEGVTPLFPFGHGLTYTSFAY
ncbi:MAG: glycoside hydrolase family 3 domain protein, partial [Streptomyces oryziradicis]|nr:glycoside hydrolase family 3 domain protein [Actinacidiphila oryziradicis]